jgi:phytoene dehydrogenase-like protein
VFEATDRVGGRIWSVVPPGAPHLIAEFGGMRFLENQAIVPRLIRALKLPSVPFSRGNGQNLYYLRGTRFTASQFPDPAAIPYRLPPDERGMTPAQLLLKGVDAYVPGSVALTPAEWEPIKKHRRYRGRLLADQGFWNLMQSALSSEGYEMLAATVGYPSLFENWNAVEQMEALVGDLGPGAEYRTVAGGYHRLPARLAEIARRSGAAIHLNTAVRSIAALPGGRVRLVVRTAGGAARVVNANHVIPRDPERPVETDRRA